MIVDDKNTLIWKQWEWTTKVGWMGNNDNGWPKKSIGYDNSGQYHVTMHSFAYCFIIQNCQTQQNKNTRTAESIKENVGFLQKIVAKTQKYLIP